MFGIPTSIRNILGWLSIEEAMAISKCVWESGGFPGDLVEIGNYCGKSTVVIGECLKQGASGILYSVDPHEDGLKLYGVDSLKKLIDNLEKYHLNEYVIITEETSEEFSKKWDGPIKLLFIDGDHSYEAVKTDILRWSDKVVYLGWMLFHDSNEGGVAHAISELDKDKWGFQEQVGSLTIWRNRVR